MPTPSTALLPPAATDVRSQALRVLCLQDPTEKCQQTVALVDAFKAGQWPLEPSAIAPRPADQALPGRPAAPRLIDPAQVPTRSPFTVEGRAALLHAICHIEFNAINLALDAVWRFADMPPAFYADWLQVAAEEAQHFSLLHRLLLDLRGPQGQQWAYGSFDAHDGLWAMCEKTAHDVTARMALVPRTLEARGLDATPLIQAKLRKVAVQGGAGASDAQALCDALDIILRDEVGHVAIGNRWYGWLCERQGLDPVAHYRHLVRVHAAPRLKPPFNEAARKQAGFSDTELAYLLTAG
ncbi:MAG TPA: ferritin-like domain-containing protein [Burkholderiaceae bacterium]|nr:ferritin-like domain-containing protein [Burkholderiaceae bacterium]